MKLHTMIIICLYLGRNKKECKLSGEKLILFPGLKGNGHAVECKRKEHYISYRNLKDNKLL